jgi:hypothetical protein
MLTIVAFGGQQLKVVIDFLGCRRQAIVIRSLHVVVGFFQFYKE